VLLGLADDKIGDTGSEFHAYFIQMLVHSLFQKLRRLNHQNLQKTWKTLSRMMVTRWRCPSNFKVRSLILSLIHITVESGLRHPLPDLNRHDASFTATRPNHKTHVRDLSFFSDQCTTILTLGQRTVDKVRSRHRRMHSPQVHFPG
jgi:hypothetical protein